MNVNLFPVFVVSLLSASSALGQETPDSVATTPDKMLDEVVVSATRPVISTSAEKTTYRVEDDPDSRAMTLLDMLRKVPGVTVGAQDNVTVNGSSQFAVEIDGKPNPMFSQNPGKILKAIPASVVSSIEVISSPGARYDAEGVGGIINIVMKSVGTSSEDGYTATIGLEGGNVNLGGNLFAMMQKGVLGLTLNFSKNHGDMPTMNISIDRAEDSGYRSLQSGDMINSFDNTYASLDASLRLSEADILSLSGSWSLNCFRNPFTALSQSFMHDSPLQHYIMNTATDSRSTSVSAGADYTHFFGSNRAHKLNVAYQFVTAPSRTIYQSFYSQADVADPTVIPEDYASENRSNMPEHIARAEYSLPIGDMHTIEAGGKMTWRRSTSESTDLDYHHNTTIAAAFASYGVRVGDFSGKAGLRYEHTAQKAHFLSGRGTDFSANYSNFVPSASVAWQSGPATFLSLAYSMRISRPGIYYLNPYSDDHNPLEVTQGNPGLAPERHNNLDLTFNHLFGSLMGNARLSYSFCNDGLTSLSTVRDGVKYTTFANALHNRNVALTLFASWRIGEKTTLMLNATPRFQSMHAAGLSNHGWTLSAYASLQQKLPWKLNLGVNIFAMTPQLMLQGRGMSQFVHMLTLGRGFLADDALNVTISAVNPFYARMNIKQIECGPGFTSRLTGHMDMRLVQVSVSWRIGNLKKNVQTRDHIDSDAVNSTGSSTSPQIPM